MQLTRPETAGHHHQDNAKQHRRHQIQDLQHRQQDHSDADADGNAFAAGGGQILLKLIEQHQVIAVLQTANRVDRRLNQQHITGLQHHAAQQIADHIAAPAHRHQRGVVALAKAQLPHTAAGNA